MPEQGFYLYQVGRLADEYRANHPSHETLFVKGDELSAIVDETVQRLNGGASYHVLTKCHKRAEQARKQREELVERVREKKGRRFDVAATSHGI